MGLFALSISKGTTPDGAPFFVGAEVTIKFYDDYLVWDKGLVNKEIARIYYSDIISVSYSNGNFATGAFITISTAGKNYTSKTTVEYRDLHEMANAIENMRHKARNRTYAHADAGTFQNQTGSADAMATVFPESTGAGCYLYEKWIDEKSMISILESIDNGKLLDAITTIRNLANVGLSDAKFLVDNIDKIDFKVPQSKDTLIEKLNAEAKANVSVNVSHDESPKGTDIRTEENVPVKHTENPNNIKATVQNDESQPQISKKNSKPILIGVGVAAVCILLAVLLIIIPSNKRSEELLPYKDAAMDTVEGIVSDLLDQHMFTEKAKLDALNSLTVSYKDERFTGDDFSLTAKYEFTVNGEVICIVYQIKGNLNNKKFDLVQIDSY